METMLFFVSLIWFGFMTILIARLAWQYFTYPVIRPRSPYELSRFPSVSVIVPARNESDNIEHCIKHLLCQTYPENSYEIIIVNDNSTDNTADAALEASQRPTGSITVIEAGVVPEGWLGKSNACMRGAELAKGEILCFIDADTFANKNMLTSCIAEMEEQQCDLLSFTPHEKMLGFWERAVMPWGFLMLGLGFDFRKVNNPDEPVAAANGQIMMFRRESYYSIGGHARVCDQVLEDVEIAGVVKRNNYKLYFARGESLAYTRMYRNLKDLRNGLTRIVRRILQRRRTLLVHAAVSFLLGICPFGIPVLILLLTGCWASFTCGLAVSGLLLFLLMCAWICSYFSLPLYWTLFSPLGFALWGMLILNILMASNKDIIWKDRPITTQGKNARQKTLSRVPGNKP